MTLKISGDIALKKDSALADPYYHNVSLLLQGDGANGSTTIVDSSPSPKTVTLFGDTQISTAQSKFGGASIVFDGADDYLALAANNEFAFGTGDFTIETWVWFSGFDPTTEANGVIQIAPSLFASNLNNTLAIGVRKVGGLDRWHIYARNTFFDSVATLVQNAWYHVALVRDGVTTKLYSNGTGVISVSNDSTNYTCSTVGIASIFGTNARYNLEGYVDGLRVTKGIARYTSDFTPPTAPFPEVIG